MAMENRTKNLSADPLSNNICGSTNAFSESESRIQITAIIIILVFSLVGNVVVIWIVVRNKLRKNNDLFVMNMAVSDMIVPLMVLPREITVYYTKRFLAWPFGDVFGDFSCKMYAFLENVSPSVTVLTLICMSIDRFCAIVLPTKINLVSRKTRDVMAISTWVLGSVINSPYLYTMRVVRDAQGGNECIHEWSASSSVSHAANNIYLIFTLFFHFVIPIVVLILLYSIIAVKLRAKNRAHSNHIARKRMQTARRVTIMTLIIVGVFGLLWGPYFSTMSLLAFLWNWEPPAICSWPTIILTVRYLSFAHAGVNPYVCLIFVEKYRRHITVAVERVRDATSSVLEMSRVLVGSSRSFTLQDRLDRTPTSERTINTQTTRSDVFL